MYILQTKDFYLHSTAANMSKSIQLWYTCVKIPDETVERIISSYGVSAEGSRMCTVVGQL